MIALLTIEAKFEITKSADAKVLFFINVSQLSAGGYGTPTKVVHVGDGVVK